MFLEERRDDTSTQSILRGFSLVDMWFPPLWAFRSVRMVYGFQCDQVRFVEYTRQYTHNGIIINRTN